MYIHFHVEKVSMITIKDLRHISAHIFPKEITSPDSLLYFCTMDLLLELKFNSKDIGNIATWELCIFTAVSFYWNTINVNSNTLIALYKMWYWYGVMLGLHLAPSYLQELKQTIRTKVVSKSWFSLVCYTIHNSHVIVDLQSPCFRKNLCTCWAPVTLLRSCHWSQTL